MLRVLLVQRDELLELLARDARAVLDDDAPVLLRVDDLLGRRRRLPRDAISDDPGSGAEG